MSTTKKQININKVYSNTTIVSGTAGSGKSAYMLGLCMVIGSKKCGYIFSETLPETLFSKGFEFGVVSDVKTSNTLRLFIEMTLYPNIKHIFIENISANEIDIIITLNNIAELYGVEIYIGLNENRAASLPVIIKRNHNEF